jgi:membrane protein YdbS with pleckstrin-like domain
MITLNSKQTLPPNAFWYMGLLAIIGALCLVLIGLLFHLAASSHNVACSGLLCGKVSGNQFATFLWLSAAFLLLLAYLKFKAFSFVLTDKSVSIEAGAFLRRSCTFRYDRIQDIDTYRNPLHLMLGLKSVAIWTGSPDQFAANRRRPDAQMVLSAEDADWLRGFLSDAQSAGGAGGGQPSALSGAARRSGPGMVTGLVVAVVIALAVLPMWLKAPATTSGRAASPATTAVATGPRAPPRPVARRHLVRQPATGMQTDAANYSVACAIRDPGSAGAIRACANLGQAQRCTHEADFASQPTSQPAQLSVVNRSDESVRFYWLNQAGTRALYASLPPGGHVSQASHIGAHWLVSTQDGRCLGIFDAATMTIGFF